MTATSSDLLAQWLHRGDATTTAKLAIATRAEPDGWHELTYGELDGRSSDLACWLAAAGVVPGDRVALLCLPGGDWAAAFLGILRRGAIAVPLDGKLTVAELALLSRRSGLAAAVVAQPAVPRWNEAVGGVDGTIPVIDPAVADPSSSSFLSPSGSGDADRSLDDPALLVWTSGTTGVPKGVVLSLANLAYTVDQASAVQVVVPETRWLSALPPNHLLELCCGLLPALVAGSTTFVARTVVPHELAGMTTECAVDQMVVVPMVLKLLRRHLESADGAPETLGSRLHAFYCGGAPLDPDVVTFFDRLGVAVFQGYGLTEAAPTVSMNSPQHRRLGSVGRPLPGTDVRIGPGGEILVRSPGVMLGYWEDEAATEQAVDADGWLHTGDLGFMDDDGFLFVTGRVKTQLVLDSGKKVQPEEVEEALAGSELFAEVCVVGWSDAGDGGNARGGERVCAVVVPSPVLRAQPDMGEAAAEEVRRLTTDLSGFKRPTIVRVYGGELPRTAKRTFRRADVVRLVEHIGTPP